MSYEKHHITEEQYADPLAPYTGKWSIGEVSHLLKRSLFGFRKKDAAAFLKLGSTASIEALLDVNTHLDSFPLNDYDSAGNQPVPFGKTWIHSPYIDQGDDEQRGSSMGRWIVEKLVTQDNTLLEKMTLFWNNLFSTEANIGRMNLVWNKHFLIRSNALGNFKTLARLITTDAHMLRYLNGELNTKAAPNENYARELQELFCIGKGPGAAFTESDVKEAARVLTGWKVDLEKNTSYFDAKDHDVTDKYFSAFYNNHVIKGRSGDGAGAAELNDLLDMIYANPETALFICRRLYRWFIHASIDTTTETQIIKPLAALLRKSNYEIKPVLRKLLGSRHFFDSSNRGTLIKSPIDFCIGILREFNLELSPASAFLYNYSMWHLVGEYCVAMGQNYASPPGVSGWPAYYQSPAFNKLWINTSTLPKRNEFSASMIDFGFNRLGKTFKLELTNFAASLNDPSDPDSLIAESVALLYAVPITKEAIAALKKTTLLSGQEENHYWTDAWKDHIASPEDEIKKQVVETRLKQLYRRLLNAPEYQLS